MKRFSTHLKGGIDRNKQEHGAYRRDTLIAHGEMQRFARHLGVEGQVRNKLVSIMRSLKLPENVEEEARYRKELKKITPKNKEQPLTETQVRMIIAFAKTLKRE